ncbi:UNVERIFIED_CONTAM: hypothetical protein RMT77_012598 [Armadillidium vulgare]
MPYKLRITNEEVEHELKKLGFQDLTQEAIEVFRKDLLKLIKSDLRKLKKLKEENECETEEGVYLGMEKVERELRFPTTSTPSVVLEQEMEKEKVRKDDIVTSEYETYSSEKSEATSRQASSLSSESSDKVADENLRKQREKEKPTMSVAVRKKDKPQKVKQKPELPSYPEKPDPVNLYHFYKAHWDKFKVPGEDPRSALRWDIRSKLFYSNL